MSVKLISVTPDAEQTMAYVARVSNPNNQENPNYAKLLAYCIKHNHWSVFEQAFMTLEIETNRGIAAQILRHRSFTYQEFSQRYADTNLLTENIPVPDLRRQDTKNRQNSTDDLGDYVKLKFQAEIAELFTQSNNLYKRLLEAGVAKECARFVLPLATPTRIYMSGSCRSWITYIALREKSGTQREHMDIAKACKAVFAEQFPICYEALGGDADWNI
jgi:thymidylate synthase (FAD)